MFKPTSVGHLKAAKKSIIDYTLDLDHFCIHWKQIVCKYTRCLLYFERRITFQGRKWFIGSLYANKKNKNEVQVLDCDFIMFWGFSIKKVITEKETKQKMLEAQLQTTKTEKDQQSEAILQARQDILSNFSDLMETELQCSICNELYIQVGFSMILMNMI